MTKIFIQILKNKQYIFNWSKSPTVWRTFELNINTRNHSNLFDFLN